MILEPLNDTEEILNHYLNAAKVAKDIKAKLKAALAHCKVSGA